MIAIDAMLVGVVIACGIYLFKRADYSRDRNFAVDNWILFHGDTLWEHISLIGKIACLGFLGLAGCLIWLDVTKPEGMTPTIETFLRPTTGPVYGVWISAAVLLLGLVFGAIGTVLHHCYEKQDSLPARRILGRNVLLGIIGGSLGALNLPQIPDGTIGMLFKKAFTLDLTDELVGRVTRSLHIDNPDFYRSVLEMSPTIKIVGLVVAGWMVLTLFTHAHWRRAADPRRFLVYPLVALVFGAAVYVLFAQVGIFLIGYALQFVLYTISLVVAIVLLAIAIPLLLSAANSSMTSSSSAASSGDSYSTVTAGDGTTVYRDADGNEYSGSGRRPDSVYGGAFYDKATYDRSSLDGKFYERFGNRVLTPDD